MRSSGNQKARGKSEELKGKAKQVHARATDNPRLAAEGRADRTRGALRQAAAKLRDAFRPDPARRR